MSPVTPRLRASRATRDRDQSYIGKHPAGETGCVRAAERPRNVRSSFKSGGKADILDRQLRAHKPTSGRLWQRGAIDNGCREDAPESILALKEFVARGRPAGEKVAGRRDRRNRESIAIDHKGPQVLLPGIVLVP
jgi:hypothetical protein